jgi:hypothetical protein
MDQPVFPQQPGALPHPAPPPSHIRRLQPLTFPPAHSLPPRFREAGAASTGHGVYESHGFSPVAVPAVGSVGHIPVFHPQGLNSPVQSPYGSPPSLHGGFGGLSHVQAASPGAQHRNLHLHPPRQRQTPESRDRSPLALSATDVVALPPLSQVGLLPSSSAGGRVVPSGVPRAESADPVRTTTPATGGSVSLEPIRGRQLSTDVVVEEPPDLGRWRQRLFDLEAPVVLTAEE